MAVELFRKCGDGSVEKTLSDPHLFENEVKYGGWFLSEEEALAEDTLEIYPMTDDEVRAVAKDKGVKHWHTKSINRLKEELESWQPET